MSCPFLWCDPAKVKATRTSIKLLSFRFSFGSINQYVNPKIKIGMDLIWKHLEREEMLYF